MADENFPGDAVALLQQAGHDVTWVRTQMPGASDDEVLRQAQSDGRVVVTFDKDFGELVYRQGFAAESGLSCFDSR